MCDSLKPSVLQRRWCGRNTYRPGRGEVRRRVATGQVILLLVLIAALAPNVGFAAPPPAETVRGGLFYTVTHFHPIVYLALFLIFVSSVVNLVLQGWLFRGDRPFSSLFSPLGGSDGLLVRMPKAKGLRRPKRGQSSAEYGSPEVVGSGVLAVRRVATPPEDAGAAQVPTPLDGVNHPMPKFTSRLPAHTGAPRMVESKPEKRGVSGDFRFLAAVDVPSREEIDRREKQQLVVCGSVIGPDGQGIPSVMVYLTDEQGTRLGQSCRTQSDTGEFKVLVNEPGRYLVNAYKRGHILEGPGPMLLPIESGKIDGFNIKMLPEGCTVHGKVSAERDGAPVSGVEVKCVCRTGGFSRSATTDDEGKFLIAGIPVNSACHLELIGENGIVLTRSDPFETVQKKAIHRSLTLPRSAAGRPLKPSSGANGPVDGGEETPGDQMPTAGSTVATP